MPDPDWREEVRRAARGPHRLGQLHSLPRALGADGLGRLPLYRQPLPAARRRRRRLAIDCGPRRRRLRLRLHRFAWLRRMSGVPVGRPATVCVTEG